MYDLSEKKNYFLTWFLFFLSLLYRGLLKIRQFLFTMKILRVKKLPCMVISVGNITAGGTGKTPLSMYLARLLTGLGYRLVIISRGYKGTATKKGGIAADGRQILMNPGMAGDEPILLASQLPGVPVVVGRDRYQAGLTALKKFKADIILLDDGFQHLKLKRDLNLLLLDARTPLGNRYLLPRGTLREPRSQIKRADALVFTHAEDISKIEIKTQPAFYCQHCAYINTIVLSGKKLTPQALCSKPVPLKKKQVFGFSGIARNIDFKQTLQSLPYNLVGFKGYQDHHAYSDTDLQDLIHEAQAAGAQLLATTEKDYIRLTGQTLTFDLIIIGIKIKFNTDQFDRFIKNHIKKLK